MGNPGETDKNQTPRYEDSTPAEIRRKVAAHRIYQAKARRRRRSYLRAALLLAIFSLAAPLLVRHGRGLAHDCRTWFTHANRGHHRHYARRG